MAVNFAKFVRTMAIEQLRPLLEKACPAFTADQDWDQPVARLKQDIIRSSETMSEEEYTRLLESAERLCEMQDELGQAALLFVAPNAAALEKLPDPLSRGCLLLLLHPAAFQRAEEIRYADNSFNSRIWAAFTVVDASPPDVSPDKQQQLEEAFRETLTSSRNLKIDLYQRPRRNLDNQQAVVQCIVYHEGMTQTAQTFQEGRIESLSYKPVQEAVLVYEQEKKLLEVIHPDKDVRVDLARAFARVVLGTNGHCDKIKLRQVDLSPLAREMPFGTDPQDRIRSVRVTMLRLRTHGTPNRIMLEVAAGEDRSIQAFSNDTFGKTGALASDYMIQQARLAIQFEPEQGRRKGKTINVKLSYPNGCDLRNPTEREQKIGKKYLREWGLMQEY
jgi:hypothetical protein